MMPQSCKGWRYVFLRQFIRERRFGLKFGEMARFEPRSWSEM